MAVDLTNENRRRIEQAKAELERMLVIAIQAGDIDAVSVRCTIQQRRCGRVSSIIERRVLAESP